MNPKALCVSNDLGEWSYGRGKIFLVSTGVLSSSSLLPGTVSPCLRIPRPGSAPSAPYGVESAGIFFPVFSSFRYTLTKSGHPVDTQDQLDIMGVRCYVTV